MGRYVFRCLSFALPYFLSLSSSWSSLSLLFLRLSFSRGTGVFLTDPFPGPSPSSGPGSCANERGTEEHGTYHGSIT
ncbi:hypothetical protein F5X96DRAFT_157851 [Biscogniauxia mediterranea]|nr:hypothetical protein F5X96DRAFT_157851 [Biscogniauxia mediterranea]